ncbi:MAG: Rieske (2Fe-2S) protein [Nitrososphaerales archaeon]
MHHVKNLDAFVELKPVFVEVGALKIAVYKFQGRFYAYLDRCPHQGGPSSEGIVIADVESKIMSDGSVKKYNSSEKYNIACPWHGYEYDLSTGVCRANPKEMLRSYEVVVENNEVLVKI